MTKIVLYGKESRDKMLKGVQAITKAVAVTMGAAGRCVLIGEGVYGNDGMIQLPTKVSKDGVTVARHFELSDVIENRGAMLIKEAANKTVDQAGDATTATVVLAESLITNGMKLVDEGANPQELKKGMDKALEYVVEELKKISIPVKGDLKRIEQVATVSANNDSSIGKLIAEAYSKIGDFGVIDIEVGSGVETTIKIADGLKFDRGWISPLFVTNPAKETCEFENPLILLYEKAIIHNTQVQKALKLAIEQKRSLLILCEDAKDEGLAFMAMNNYRKSVSCCVVKSPEFGEARREWMEDLALITGAHYVSDIRGVAIKDIQANHLGEAKKSIISKTETVIIGGNGDQVKIDELVNDLKMNLTQAKTEDEKYLIEKRIARLTGGVAVIQVGAATETELNEKLDRVDDAVRATKSAIAEGVVVGGGAAFLRIPLRTNGVSIDLSALENMDIDLEEVIKIYNQTGSIISSCATEIKFNEFGIGGNLLSQALMKPFIQICENAGVDWKTNLKIVLMRGGNIGYNVLSSKTEDLLEAGVIDSTKALRCALTNAVSVAGMLLTSECSIITVH